MDFTVLVLAISGFLLVLLAAVAGYLQLRLIHAAVNSNMTTALNKIDELHSKLAEVQAELLREQKRGDR